LPIPTGALIGPAIRAFLTTLHHSSESIKTARNNLFHGDKTHNNHRDTELMKGALFILNAAYDAAVKEEKFHEFIDAMEYGL
jgi:hypothetical protein